MRQADGAVEESQIGTHVTVALQGVGDDGEGHGEHGGPAATDEQEGQYLQILVGTEGDEQEAQATQHQTDAIGHLYILEARQQRGPHHGAHGLDGIEHARPVAGCLIVFGGGVGSAPDGERHGVDDIGPHVEHAGPAEELHQTYFPKGDRGLAKEGEPVGGGISCGLRGGFYSLTGGRG